jgi:rhodanese-related sulfurtransferase
MGILIDLEDENTYLSWHDYRAINITYNKLIYNFNNILDKNKVYYFYCRGGIKSRRIVNILKIYNYRAYQVLLDK